MFFHATASALEIEVRDDGQGFDSLKPATPGKRQGRGNMQARAAAISGTLTMQSAPGKGTSVKLRVDFPAPTA